MNNPFFFSLGDLGGFAPTGIVIALEISHCIHIAPGMTAPRENCECPRFECMGAKR
jgi:hypothetical protein